MSYYIQCLFFTRAAQIIIRPIRHYHIYNLHFLVQIDAKNVSTLTFDLNSRFEQFAK